MRSSSWAAASCSSARTERTGGLSRVLVTHARLDAPLRLA
jgi:hypothetical protein